LLDVKCLCNDNYSDLVARNELCKAELAAIEGEEGAPFLRVHISK